MLARRSALKIAGSLLLALSPSVAALAQDAAGSGFPPADPKNFTATAPSKATVEAFLKLSWGYDEDRLWQVQAIQTTPATGVSKVTILVAQKSNPQQIAPVTFLVTPDGKHLISNDLSMLNFGDHPFDEPRRMLEQRANGPSKGSADKKNEMVEFADFQCPHCKAAQPVIARLVADFPNVHFVFQNFPLTSIHSEAYKAAAYSVCAAQQGGNEAFFKFADAVFTNQENLTPQSSDATLGDAVTAAGLDPAKIGSCSYTAAAKKAVDDSVKLAGDMNVNETPTLFVNGRQVPLSGVTSNQLPYDELKKIIEFQLSLN